MHLSHLDKDAVIVLAICPDDIKNLAEVYPISDEVKECIMDNFEEFTTCFEQIINEDGYFGQAIRQTVTDFPEWLEKTIAAISQTDEWNADLARQAQGEIL